MNLIDKIKKNAAALGKRIVLPESFDDRVLQAAEDIASQNIAKVTLIGNPSEIEKKFKELNLTNFSKIEVIDNENIPDKQRYKDLLFEVRKGKGLTDEDAEKTLKNHLYLGCLLVKSGKVDGMVAGSIASTADMLRATFQIIKTAPGISIISSCFLMVFDNHPLVPDGCLFYADCGVNPNPNAQQLAEIAISTARSAKAIADIDPRIAMLSFSTKGSAKDPILEKVIEATGIAKQLDSTLKIDGELQGDAALVAKVGASKAPGSEIAGKANVLVFPDLNAGNIAYKLTERLAGAVAIGPLLQGVAAPINDLSRGCSVEDIVIAVAITANQAKK